MVASEILLVAIETCDGVVDIVGFVDGLNVGVNVTGSIIFVVGSVVGGLSVGFIVENDVGLGVECTMMTVSVLGFVLLTVKFVPVLIGPYGGNVSCP